MRILLVGGEDCEFICDILKHDGHQVFLACDGREAREVFYHYGLVFDQIIVDQNLGGTEMNGLGLVRQIRYCWSTDVRVVLVSAIAYLPGPGRTPLKVLCTKLGAEFLERPFSFNQLLALLTSPIDTNVTAPR